MELKIGLVVIATIIALLGWTLPAKKPIWAIVFVVILLVSGVSMSIVLEMEADQNNKDLNSEITQLTKKLNEKPKLKLNVAGSFIDEYNQKVKIKETEGNYIIEFTLSNTGKAPANNIRAHLYYPEGVYVSRIGNYWEKQGKEIYTSKGSSHNSLHESSIYLSPRPIHPSNSHLFGKAIIPKDKISRNPIPFILVVSTSNGYTNRWTFLVEFVNDQNEQI
tara:strand:- start:5997 stop:6656 length:660 start_codon:yes stop_codon:yes gene_type:complete